MDTLMSMLVQKLQSSGALAGKPAGKSFQKDDRKLTTIFEQVVPNGSTPLSLTLRRPIDPTTNNPIDGSYFVSVEHFLKHSKEGSKSLCKVNVAAKKEVLASFGFIFTEMSKRL